MGEQAIEQRPKLELSDAAKRWQEENRAAIESINAYVAANGLPFEEFRQV